MSVDPWLAWEWGSKAMCTAIIMRDPRICSFLISLEKVLSLRPWGADSQPGVDGWRGLTLWYVWSNVAQPRLCLVSLSQSPSATLSAERKSPLSCRALGGAIAFVERGLPPLIVLYIKHQLIRVPCLRPYPTLHSTFCLKPWVLQKGIILFLVSIQLLTLGFGFVYSVRSLPISQSVFHLKDLLPGLITVMSIPAHFFLVWLLLPFSADFRMA